jgi:hypothetical protein
MNPDFRRDEIDELGGGASGDGEKERVGFFVLQNSVLGRERNRLV